MGLLYSVQFSSHMNKVRMFASVILYFAFSALVFSAILVSASLSVYDVAVML